MKQSNPHYYFDLISRVRIEDVARNLLHWDMAEEGKKKAGKLVRSCPFHAENTPSFQIDPGKQRFKCWGCGKSGDALDLLELGLYGEIQGPGHNEARDELAAFAGMDPLSSSLKPEEVEAAKKVRAEARECFEAMTAWVEDCHLALPSSLREQITREWGLEDEAIDSWKIGFADSGPRQFEILKQFSLEACLATGLLNLGKPEKGSKKYAFIKNRLVFPHWSRGRVEYLKGRKIEGSLASGVPREFLTRCGPDLDPEGYELAKYKGPKAQGFVRQRMIVDLKPGDEDLVIVEGGPDTIAVDQAGWSVVGLAGLGPRYSDAAEELIGICRKFKRVYIITDSDEGKEDDRGNVTFAGLKGAKEIALLLLRAGVHSVYLSSLPQEDGGKADPASFLRDVARQAMADADEIDEEDGKKLRRRARRVALQAVLDSSRSLPRTLLEEVPEGIEESQIPSRLGEVLEVISLYPEQDWTGLLDPAKDRWKMRAAQVKGLKAKIKDLAKAREVKEAKERRRQDRSDEEESASDHDERPIVSNFTARPDPENPEETLRFEVPQGKIVEMVHEATGGWPKAFDNLLFAFKPPKPGELPKEEAIRYLAKEPMFFAWLRGHAQVEWTGKDVLTEGRLSGHNPVNRSELLHAAEMEATERFRAVELLPHYPEMPGTFYACRGLPQGDGKTLAAFVSLFNPDTEADRNLLEAALLTLAWGGPPGKRPCMLLTSNYGVGVGKTATATAIAAVFGGHIDRKIDEDWQTFASRLLDDNALSKRAVQVDNLKGRVSSAEIESAITMSVINGKKMYVGNMSRPNTLTWFLTVNIAELSRDLADRCVVSQIGPKKHNVNFEGQVEEFLGPRRRDLLCDIVTLLKSEPKCAISLENRDRFQAWQDAVLTRFENGNELAALVKSRRPGIDSDSEDAQNIADTLAELLRKRGHCPAHDFVFIPGAVAKLLLVRDLDTKNDKEFKSVFKALCQNKPLRHIDPFVKTTGGARGLKWNPTRIIDLPGNVVASRHYLTLAEEVSKGSSRWDDYDDAGNEQSGCKYCLEAVAREARGTQTVAAGNPGHDYREAREAGEAGENIFQPCEKNHSCQGDEVSQEKIIPVREGYNDENVPLVPPPALALTQDVPLGSGKRQEGLRLVSEDGFPISKKIPSRW